MRSPAERHSYERGRNKVFGTTVEAVIGGIFHQYVRFGLVLPRVHFIDVFLLYRAVRRPTQCLTRMFYRTWMYHGHLRAM